MFVLYSYESYESSNGDVHLIACSKHRDRLETIKADLIKDVQMARAATVSFHRNLHALTQAHPHDRTADLRLTDPERVNNYWAWLKPLQQQAFDQTIEEHGTHLLDRFPNASVLKTTTSFDECFEIEEIEEVFDEA